MFKQAFVKSIRNAGTILLAVCTVGSFFFPSASCTVKIALIAALVLYVLVSTIVRWIHDLNAVIQEQEDEIAKLKSAEKESLRIKVIQYDREGEHDRFYLEYTEVLREDTLVSIYYKKDDLDRLVCNGRVQFVVKDNAVTIEVIDGSVTGGRENLLNEIKTHKQTTLDKLYVLPVVKMEQVKNLYNELLKTNESPQGTAIDGTTQGDTRSGLQQKKDAGPKAYM